MNPGQPVLSEAKDDGGVGDKWSYRRCKAPVKSSPSTNQHPVFLKAGCPSCRPTNSVKALKGKYHIPRTCLPQSKLKADYNLQSMQCTVMLIVRTWKHTGACKNNCSRNLQSLCCSDTTTSNSPLAENTMAPPHPAVSFVKLYFICIF